MAAIDPLNAPRIQFLQDGTLTGTTGCSEFRARASITGERISIDAVELLGTNPCPEHERQVERSLLEALATAERMSGGLPGGTLTISGPTGEVVLMQP